MKLLLLCLITFQSATSFAGACRKACNAEYNRGVDEVYQSTQAYKVGKPPEVIETIEAYARSKYLVCRKVQKKCYRRCRHPEQALPEVGSEDVSFQESLQHD